MPLSCQTHRMLFATSGSLYGPRGPRRAAVRVRMMRPTCATIIAKVAPAQSQRTQRCLRSARRVNNPGGESVRKNPRRAEPLLGELGPPAFFMLEAQGRPTTAQPSSRARRLIRAATPIRLMISDSDSVAAMWPPTIMSRFAAAAARAGFRDMNLVCTPRAAPSLSRVVHTCPMDFRSSCSSRSSSSPSSSSRSAPKCSYAC